MLRREGKRGAVWYAKYRLPDGCQVSEVEKTPLTRSGDIDALSPPEEVFALARAPSPSRTPQS